MNFREAAGTLANYFRVHWARAKWATAIANDPKQRALIRYIETFPKSMRPWIANRMCERASRGESPFPPSSNETKYVKGQVVDREVTVVDFETGEVESGEA